MRAVVITALGNAIRTDHTELDDMQRAVGGLVDAIDVHINDQECTIWFNEEGKFRRLPANGIATALAHGTISSTDYIVGDVLITGSTGPSGEMLPLHEDAESFLLRLVGRSQ